MSSQTVYAIKKVETNGNNNNNNGSNENNNNATTDDGSSNQQQQQNASQSPQTTPNGSSQSAATSVWQKKKRKRGKKNKSSNSSSIDNNNNNNDNNTNQEDGKQDNNALNAIDTNKNNDLELISKSEGDIIIKQTQISALKPGQVDKQQKSAPGYDPKSNPYSRENFERDPALQQTLTAKAKTKTSSLTGIKLAPKRLDPASDALPIGSTQLTNSASSTTTNVNKPPAINANLPAKSPMSQVRLTPLFPSPQIPTAYNVRPTVPTHLTLNGQHPHIIHNPHPQIIHHHHHEAPVARTYQRLNTQTHHHHHHGHSVHPTAQHLNPADTDPTQCPHGNLSSE